MAEVPGVRLAPPLANATQPLITPTYDGSGEVTHPDIAHFPGGLHGWEYWLVVTPYPGDDIGKENPSVLVSHDGVTWQEPAGITNPIALPGATFLADGDLFYDQASGRLWVYYIQQRVERQAYVMRQASTDGIDWGPQIQDLSRYLVCVPDYELLSPAVAKAGDTYWMWSVNTGRVGCHAATTRIECRTSADGSIWSAPTAVHFSQPGYWPWHLDVIHVPSKNEFWMLVSAFPEGGSCHDGVLFFANSTDGIHWTTYRRPALTAGAGQAWDCGQIYRSTLLYDATSDLLKVWYSANDGKHWHLGETERHYRAFLAQLLANVE
jgi:hypothetical protein